MNNPFAFSLDNKRYNTINYFFKTKFGKKAYKVPLSLGTNCPNRDGTKAFGGCIYCLSGGGGTEFLASTLKEQFDENSLALESKWPDSLKVAYFQSFSNTYLPAEMLRSALNEVLTLPKVTAISIATRPDCLPDDILEVLNEFRTKTMLIVELGLQTAHNCTADLINRGHSYDEFVEGYNKLVSLDIPVCIHLINGLPFETEDMMLETASKLAELNPHSVKFHMLHVLKGTVIEDMLLRTNPFPLLSKEEYVDIVARQIELLPPTTVIQRITGDPTKDELIAPLWTTDKLWVRNNLDKWFAKRGSYQGINYTAK